MSRKINPNSLPPAPTPQQVRQALVTQYPDFSRASLTPGGDYTTSGRVGWETIYAGDGDTISLHSSPAAGQRVTVYAGGSITLDTAGAETIDGLASLAMGTGESITIEAVSDGANTNYEILAMASGQGVPSAGNTSTTPLTSGATYTGTWEQNGYPQVMVSCQADNSGTLYFDFSNDGTNSSTFPVNGFKVESGVHEFHVAVKGPRYFRVRLVNDTGAQSYLRLYTYYGSEFSRPNAPVNQSVGRDNDSVLVRSYSEPQDEIVIGKRPGVAHYTKFAYLPDVDTADNAIMITADPAKPTGPEVLSSAETFTIAYNATTDGASTTGATVLYFDYIDANGMMATASHVLGSSSPDTTSFSGLGINRIAVASSGSNDTNGSAITVTSSSSGGVHGYIPAGEGVTQQAMFHMPAAASGVAKLLFANVNKIGGGSPKVTLKGWVHNRNVDTKFEVFRYIIDTSVENHFVLNEPVGFKLSAADILYFTASTDTNNSTVASLRFSLNVYEDA